MATTRQVSLDVYDDPICANCYMGYYELGNAIKFAKETLQLPLNFNLEYHPLRLICSEALPDDVTVDKEAFLAEKFGPEGFAAFQKGILQWAQKKGLNITWRSKLSSSTLAFRLSLKALKTGGKMAQYPLHAAIYKAHLERGQDISDINLLADLASNLGIMSHEEAVAFLQSDECKDEVDELVREARAKGINRVPTVVVNKKFKIDGAQCAGVYLSIFQKLAMQGDLPTTTPAPIAQAPTSLVQG